MCGKDKLESELFCQIFYKRVSIQFFLISSVASKSKTMLVYCKITQSDGIDNPEGADVVCNSGVSLLNSVRFVTSTF